MAGKKIKAKLNGDITVAQSIAADKRLLAAKLYLRGYPQVAIGKEIGCSQAQVSRLLVSLQAEWEMAYKRSIYELKMKELARIDSLEMEYWDAWRRSIGTTIRKTVKDRAGSKDSFNEEQTTEIDLVGNPSFLQGIQWCIERRCKLIGLDAPTKIAPTDPTGEYEYQTPLTGREIFQRLVAIVSSSEASGNSD